MTKELSPIIKASELLKIYKNENVKLIDANFGPNALANYKAKHLERALFVDLNTQLADIKKDFAEGGRHPLPSPKLFSETLKDLGISKKNHVIIYDNKNGASAAARFWWMLKSAGHKKVQVLDGGFNEAIKVGFPTSIKIEYPVKGDAYIIDKWILPLADIFEVEKLSKDNNHRVIDVRETERYDGIAEPIDLIAGHIPGAINVPYMSNLDTNGLFKEPTELKKKYQKITNNLSIENIIVHCGSGVTACHTLLAMAYAGLEIPKLYVGSWSEWSRNNKFIATKENEDCKS